MTTLRKITLLGLVAVWAFCLGLPSVHAQNSSWRQDQEEILVNGSWEAALTDADGTHGSVRLNFYPNGRFRITAWARDPQTGRQTQAESKMGRWRLDPRSQWSAILHVTVDGSSSEQQFLEIFPNGMQPVQQVGISRQSGGPASRILFVDRR